MLPQGPQREMARAKGIKKWSKAYKKRKLMVQNVKTSLIKRLTPSSEECGEKSSKKKAYS